VTTVSRTAKVTITTSTTSCNFQRRKNKSKQLHYVQMYLNEHLAVLQDLLWFSQEQTITKTCNVKVLREWTWRLPEANLLHKGWLDRTTFSREEKVSALENQLNKVLWFL